jgi:predicted phosphodiesterase
MKIHYLSDIHLELYDITKIPYLLQKIIPQSNICVLAGDIGYVFQKTYISFLRGISPKFEHIFLIHGNHEYYQLKENKGKTHQEIIQKTHEIILQYNLHNIHFLNNSHYDLDEYRFIGSILWSKIENTQFLSNDYSHIYMNDVTTMNDTHTQCVNYIQDSISQARDLQKKVIVITHYLPSYKLNHPKYAKYYNYFQCFSSHCDYLIKDPVKLWVFGHTHMHIYEKINDVICVANPIGYKDEKTNIDIDYNKVIEI